jgi:hypothetical protein
MRCASVFCAALLSATVAPAADHPATAPLDQYLTHGPAQIAPAKAAAPRAGAPGYMMAKHWLTRPNSDL